MSQTQRLEFITNTVELSRITQTLDQLGIKGYSIIRNVAGMGEHGKSGDDLDATTLGNVYVIILCSPAEVTAITTALRPILQRYGGIAWVSEVEQLFP
jgi:nitrogen regulatory protein PII